MKLFGITLGEKISNIESIFSIKDNYEILDTMEPKIGENDFGEVSEIRVKIISKDISSHLSNYSLLKRILIEQGMEIPLIDELTDIKNDSLSAINYFFHEDIICKMEYIKKCWKYSEIFTLDIKLYKEIDNNIALTGIRHEKITFKEILNSIYDPNIAMNIFNCRINYEYDANEIKYILKEDLKTVIEYVHFEPTKENNKLIGVSFHFYCKPYVERLYGDISGETKALEFILNDLRNVNIKKIYKEFLDEWDISIYETYNFVIIFKRNVITHELIFIIKVKDCFLEQIK